VFGRYPFQEAAFIGGAETLRGLRPQRYAGDASAYASAEVRLRLGNVRIPLPSEFGLFGLVDVGRVFASGESTGRLHRGVGGGVWVSVLRPENTVSLAFARSEGETRLYFRTGFGF
jgi:hemolysin activation/secretion protein